VSATALWAENGLTRPWNDPAADFLRAIEGATSAILGIKRNGELIGTVMVGTDGHRQDPPTRRYWFRTYEGR
jgi:hypothetical protein